MEGAAEQVPGILSRLSSLSGISVSTRCRALVLASRLFNKKKDEACLNFIASYLDGLQDAGPGGGNSPEEELLTGLAIWSTGITVAANPGLALKRRAEEIFYSAAATSQELKQLLPLSYAAIGMGEVVKHAQVKIVELESLIKRTGDMLVRAFEENKKNAEPAFNADAPRLVHALLYVQETFNYEKYTYACNEALHTLQKMPVKPSTNLEGLALLECFLKASELTKDEQYLERARKSYDGLLSSHAQEADDIDSALAFELAKVTFESVKM